MDYPYCRATKVKRTFLITTIVCFVITARAHAQGNRGPVMIHAINLAPESQRADEPTKGKWWLQQDGDITILRNGKVNDTKAVPGEWQVAPVDRFVPY